jgi:hypothetical protein
VIQVARKNAMLALLAAVATGFVLVAGARSVDAPQLLTLNPIVVANGTAAVSGSVGGAGARAQLTVNGHPLSLDATGGFAGVVALDGASSLELAVATPATGERVVFEIPLTAALLGPGGVIPGNVIDAVEQAGAKLLEPVGGFRTIAGEPLTVSGTVLDRDQLVGLSVNGKDVLGLLGPDQSFTIQLPGTTKEITLTVEDAEGVTDTTYYRVLEPTTVLRTRAGDSIAASQATGLRIAKVRYSTRGLVRTKRVRMIVTVKDSRGYLVRGAKITVRSKAAGRLTRRSQAKRSGRTGQAGFVLRVRPRMLGKRLVMVTVARTPTAKASKVSSVRLAARRH